MSTKTFALVHARTNHLLLCPSIGASAYGFLTATTRDDSARRCGAPASRGGKARIRWDQSVCATVVDSRSLTLLHLMPWRILIFTLLERPLQAESPPAGVR